MLTDVPTAKEFKAASLEYLNLAWEIGMQIYIDLQNSEIEEWDSDKGVSDEYWEKSQPALANAYALIQQGQEFALKGKIAAISPLLLLTRDPRDWPKRCEFDDISFSQFRMADSADLIKIYNTFGNPRLPEEFSEFFDEIRRQRNVIMHHGGKEKRIPVAELFINIIKTYKTLFNDKSWARQRRKYLDNDRVSIIYTNEHVGANLITEFEALVKILSPKDAFNLLGFNKKSRRYLCPVCIDDARHLVSYVHLAQLQPNKPNSTSIYCFVCGTTTKVRRDQCNHAGCKANVIADEGDHKGECLLDFHEQ